MEFSHSPEVERDENRARNNHASEPEQPLLDDEAHTYLLVKVQLRLNYPLYLKCQLLSPRMEFLVRFAETLVGDVGINLSRRDVRMAEKHLHGTQVCTI